MSRRHGKRRGRDRHSNRKHQNAENRPSINLSRQNVEKIPAILIDLSGEIASSNAKTNDQSLRSEDLVRIAPEQDRAVLPKVVEHSNTGHTRHRVFVDAIIGLLLTVALLTGKIFFEHVYGRQITYFTYDWLQSLLKDEETNVVIVDSTQLPVQQLKNGRLVTDREKLTKLLDAVVLAKPRAVAIDIDFSPDYLKSDLRHENPIYHDEKHDPAFFSHCTELTKSGINIFVGVFLSSEERA